MFLRVAYIALLWSLFLVAGIGRFLPLPKGRPVRFEPPLPRQQVSWLTTSDLLSDELRTEFEKRYERNFPFRGYLIRSDNAFNRFAFKESRPGKQVVIGQDKYLFHIEDIIYVNKELPCPQCVTLAQDVASLQKEMLATGRLLLPVVTPAKTSFYLSKVAPRWRPSTTPPSADQLYYKTFVNELHRLGVLFVDSRELLASFTKGAVFPVKGRHWTSAAACYVFQDAVRKVQSSLQLRADDVPIPDCAFAPPGPSADLAALFNGLGEDNPDPSHARTVPITNNAIKALVVGTSFMWDFTWLLTRQPYGGHAKFAYYNSSLFELQSQQVLPNKIEGESDQWQEFLLSRNVIIVDFLESFLPEAPYTSFAPQMRKALKRTTAVQQ